MHDQLKIPSECCDQAEIKTCTCSPGGYLFCRKYNCAINPTGYTCGLCKGGRPPVVRKDLRGCSDCRKKMLRAMKERADTEVDAEVYDQSGGSTPGATTTDAPPPLWATTPGRMT